MTDRGDNPGNMGDFSLQLFGRRDCERIAKANRKGELLTAVAIVTEHLKSIIDGQDRLAVNDGGDAGRPQCGGKRSA